MTDNVCRECHKVLDGKVCPTCGSGTASRDWSGYVIVIDAERSEIAKRLNIDVAGKYALKVR